MKIAPEKLKTFLTDAQLISAGDFEEAKSRAEESNSQSLTDTLMTVGKIEEDDLRRVQAHILGIPFVSLKDEKIDFDTLSLIPEPVARNHNVVAYNKDQDNLEVAMLDVDDLPAIDFIKKKTGLNIKPRLTDTESIKSALVQYQKSLKAEFGDIIQKESQALKTVADKDDEEVSEKELKEAAEDLPVVRIVDTLLKHAILQGASDIHIEPQEDQLLVRYRIDGILHDAMTLPKHAANAITARIKVLSDLKLDERRLPQDGRFKVEMEREKVSFRVSVLPTHYGEKTVMRLLRDNVRGFTLESLGFHGENLERLHWATNQKTGMILVTGPTGSGKSTTLYTILDILNTPEVNISTVEDPVEYQMPRINQTQVNPEIGFTFSVGLRSLVRQDPDIIMVGEIRDHETASLAVNAALTGHLVLSTLHTNSAGGAIARLVDMQVEPFLITSTVKVIVGQRLVRRLCPDREKYFLSSSQKEKLEKLVDMDKILQALQDEGVVGKDDGWSNVPFYKAIETSECESGFKGRVGIHEVLKVTPTINELVMNDATSEEITKQAEEEGMHRMIEDGIFKAAQGITTIEEVLRVVSE